MGAFISWIIVYAVLGNMGKMWVAIIILIVFWFIYNIYQITEGDMSVLTGVFLGGIKSYFLSSALKEYNKVNGSNVGSTKSV
jgi:hypothetical protein